MKKTNVFNKIKESIYNIKSPPSYIKEGVLRALLYAMVLCIILGIANGSRVIYDSKLGIDSFEEFLSSEDYEFTIEGGTLDIKTNEAEIQEKSMTYYINDEVSIEKKEDIRRKTIHYNNYILVLKDGIVIESNMIGVTGGTELEFYYKDILQAESLTNEDILNILPLIRRFTSGINIISSVINTSLSYIIDSAFISLMLLFTIYTLRLKLKYKELFSLTLYAATFPTIVVTILTIIKPDVYLGTAKMVGILIYTFLILKDMNKELGLKEI